ncbi:hypothetical protein DL771_011662 [Monosporascus sp. 5C6A]|nr:hypothetical protein DL771_011662 [Monosporascus sp. 5C6A]
MYHYEAPALPFSPFSHSPHVFLAEEQIILDPNGNTDVIGDAQAISYGTTLRGMLLTIWIPTASEVGVQRAYPRRGINSENNDAPMRAALRSVRRKKQISNPDSSYSNFNLEENGADASLNIFITIEALDSGEWWEKILGAAAAIGGALSGARVAGVGLAALNLLK